jgi:hypothetical protein
MGLRHLAVVSMRHEVLGIITRKDLAILERNHALDSFRRSALARVRYILPDNCDGRRPYFCCCFVSHSLTLNLFRLFGRAE